MNTNNLNNLLNELLEDAQNLFGELLNDWTFYGIEIKDRQPCLMYYPKTGRVTISLSQKVIEDDMQLVFQLSHEICHLLYPSRERESLIKNETLVINEGVSTYYSILKMRQYFGNEDEIIQNIKNHFKDYYFAYTCVKDLLQLDPNAIKLLRKKTPRIDKLTDKDFGELIIPSELKRNLLVPFSKVAKI